MKISVICTQQWISSGLFLTLNFPGKEKWMIPQFLLPYDHYAKNIRFQKILSLPILHFIFLLYHDTNLKDSYFSFVKFY